MPTKSFGKTLRLPTSYNVILQKPRAKLLGKHDLVACDSYEYVNARSYVSDYVIAKPYNPFQVLQATRSHEAYYFVHAI